MMIRSQDKRKLYPLTKGLYTDGTNIIMDLGFSVNGDGDLQLGKYASIQRCIEILDNIQEEFEYCNHFAGSGVNKVDCQDWNYGVYQMPEK